MDNSLISKRLFCILRRTERHCWRYPAYDFVWHCCSPAGGWYPAGRISVEAALRHFTRDGAYASFDEEVRGTLTPGKLADLVVLSKDILTSPPAEILHTDVLLTVMGGRDTYRATGFE
jgi:predicted amidohydrolase YtcJ